MSTEHLPPGTVFGRRYRIDGLIAEGGMGIVYRGWHLILEQVVAIKVVRPEYAQQPLAVARFLSEARSMAKLRGVHAVRVLDTGYVEGGSPYMVLEYLEGRDLRSVLEQEGPLPVVRATDYVLQVCEALAEAHGLGMVHRDLKPENLFLTSLPDHSEIIKLIDFGISQRVDAEQRDSQSLGSPDYMAPEQMASPDRVDARADLWSLGVLLFELLTGAAPFGSDSVPQVCYRVLCQPPPSLRSLRADLPRELETVLLRCLRKRPEERFANVQQLAEALAPFASEPGAESVRRVRSILAASSSEPNGPLPLDVQWVEDPEPEPNTLPRLARRDRAVRRPPPLPRSRARAA